MPECKHPLYTTCLVYYVAPKDIVFMPAPPVIWIQSRGTQYTYKALRETYS